MVWNAVDVGGIEDDFHCKAQSVSFFFTQKIFTFCIEVLSFSEIYRMRLLGLDLRNDAVRETQLSCIGSSAYL